MAPTPSPFAKMSNSTRDRTLTPEDVVYTFKRNMISDPDGGPMWMLLEALTGKGGTRDGEGKIIDGIFEVIDRCVEAQGDQVIFHLPKAYPPFMGILAYTSSVILNRQWAAANGCWDGDIRNAARFNNPAPGHEPLLKIANGTGPYRMKAWEPSKEFVFERFDGYWGPQPALKRAIVKYVKEWSTRKLMLQNGDADRVACDTALCAGSQGHERVDPLRGAATLGLAALFCQKINPTANPDIGSGKLDGEGIPPDFFSDINVRKAFMHAFRPGDLRRRTSSTTWWFMPTSPNIEGLPFHKDVPVYEFDLDKAAEYLQKAWDGQVWEKGFEMVDHPQYRQRSA